MPAIHIQRESVVDQHNGCLSPGRHLCRAESQGQKAGRPAGQALHQFEFVINRKTAKTPGLEIPPTLLVLANQVIE
jgi:hypothetical protein